MRFELAVDECGVHDVIEKGWIVAESDDGANNSR